MKDSGSRFDKIISMIIYVYKINDMNGSTYIKIPLRSSVFPDIQKNDIYCFIWTILAYLQPKRDFKNCHAKKIQFIDNVFLN